MFALSGTFGLSGYKKQTSSFAIRLLILLVICVFGRPAEARTSIYVFVPGQSTVVQTGGIAGVHETCGIEGKFRLTVDFDTGIASFDKVDANLTDETSPVSGQSLDEIFNMTGLSGTVIDDTKIEFEGKTADVTDSDVSLTLTFIDDSAHITGKTTPPPNSADMFLYELDAGATKKYAGGTGEPNNPYQIATSGDLMLLGETPDDYDQHFILTADIDLAPNLPGRKVFDKAVIGAGAFVGYVGFEGTSFSGVLDGKGHTISNIKIIGESYLGLFGQLDNGATISNLGIEVVDVEGTDYCVGGLVGENSGGIIANCYTNGNISGSWQVGGLVGYNSYGNVAYCYSTGSVIGTEKVGGLVGENTLIPSQQGQYNTGIIGSSFWDMETSKQDTSDGAMGKTKDEMQMARTFLEAGWDFVDETANGTEDIWWIFEGQDYPRLWWELTEDESGAFAENLPAGQ